jgi:hypothetical protein
MDLRGRVEAIRKAARMAEPAGPPPVPLRSVRPPMNRSVTILLRKNTGNIG